MQNFAFEIFFRISQKYGNLNSMSFLDESVGGVEPNTVSLRRVIPVLDVNDNPPQFIGRPYAFAVPESTKVCILE